MEGSFDLPFIARVDVVALILVDHLLANRADVPRACNVYHFHVTQWAAFGVLLGV